MHLSAATDLTLQLEEQMNLIIIGATVTTGKAVIAALAAQHSRH
jgi:hypothetical protein